MLRIQSPLPDELERLAHDVLGCCIEVHRQLGPGLIEGIYARAVAMEMAACGISCEAEKPIPVHYRGALPCHQRLDLLVGGQIVVELKAVECIHVPVLKAGIRRVIL